MRTRTKVMLAVGAEIRQVEAHPGADGQARVALAVGGHGGGDDFQAGNGGGVAMPFPSDEAGDGVAVLHVGAGEEPVVGHGAGVVGAWLMAIGAATARATAVAALAIPGIE